MKIKNILMVLALVLFMIPMVSAASWWTLFLQSLNQPASFVGLDGTYFEYNGVCYERYDCVYGGCSDRIVDMSYCTGEDSSDSFNYYNLCTNGECRGADELCCGINPCAKDGLVSSAQYFTSLSECEEAGDNYECNDPDGNNIFTATTVTAGGVSAIDKCSDLYVYEYECASDGRLTHMIYACDDGYGCQDGKCVRVFDDYVALYECSDGTQAQECNSQSEQCLCRDAGDCELVYNYAFCGDDWETSAGVLPMTPEQVETNQILNEAFNDIDDPALENEIIIKCADKRGVLSVFSCLMWVQYSTWIIFGLIALALIVFLSMKGTRKWLKKKWKFLLLLGIIASIIWIFRVAITITLVIIIVVIILILLFIPPSRVLIMRLFK